MDGQASSDGRFHALIPAGGRGSRFSRQQPKQTFEIHGTPLLLWTVEAVRQPGCQSLTVALPKEWVEWGRRALSGSEVEVVEGGETRQESVVRALAASPAGPQELVLVHDGARPVLAASDLDAVVQRAALRGAAILVRRVSDTLKRKLPSGAVETVDRTDLFAAETPQVFRRELLERAFQLAEGRGWVATDEAALVEQLAVSIELVEAAEPNPKLTTPGDLAWITWLLASRFPQRGSPS